jgi:hypothetical protein
VETLHTPHLPNAGRGCIAEKLKLAFLTLSRSNFHPVSIWNANSIQITDFYFVVLAYLHCHQIKPIPGSYQVIT